MIGLVILRGDNQGKNKFKETILNNYWVWNVSPPNRIKDIAKSFSGYDEENFGFIEKLKKIANEELDFDYEYLLGFIEKAKKQNEAEKNNKKAHLIIAHGINDELAGRLQSEFPFYEIQVLINNDKQEDNFSNGHFVLGGRSETFNNDVEDVLKIIVSNITKE